MSDLTNSDSPKPTLNKLESNESNLIKTVRVTINFMTNILMCLIVFVNLIYACSYGEIYPYQLHIILCVLGYQLFMYQGTLVLYKYNSWSMYLSRLNKKRLHIWLQLLGLVLVVVGSYVIMRVEPQHFISAHGTLGIIALIMSLVSILNGVLANYAYKVSKSYVPLIKFIHYVSGILTLFISAASLSTGYYDSLFIIWAKSEFAVAGVTFLTCLFTLLVTLDFWLLSRQRLCNLI